MFITNNDTNVIDIARKTAVYCKPSESIVHFSRLGGGSVATGASGAAAGAPAGAAAAASAAGASAGAATGAASPNSFNSSWALTAGSQSTAANNPRPNIRLQRPQKCVANSRCVIMCDRP